MASNDVGSDRFIAIASLISLILGVLLVVVTALATLLLFLVSSAVSADAPGLGLIWVAMFVSWVYAISMVWSSRAVRNGSKTGWVLLVVCLSLQVLSVLNPGKVGIQRVGLVSGILTLAALTALVLLVLPDSFKWIWADRSLHVPMSMVGPGMGRGGYGMAAPPGGTYGGFAPAGPPPLAGYAAPQQERWGTPTPAAKWTPPPASWGNPEIGGQAAQPPTIPWSTSPLPPALPAQPGATPPPTPPPAPPAQPLGQPAYPVQPAATPPPTPPPVPPAQPPPASQGW